MLLSGYCLDCTEPEERVELQRLNCLVLDRRALQAGLKHADQKAWAVNAYEDRTIALVCYWHI